MNTNYKKKLTYEEYEELYFKKKAKARSIYSKISQQNNINAQKFFYNIMNTPKNFQL
jgi:hypothetical protein